MTSPDGLSYNQNLIIAITTLVLILAYVSFGLRLYARRVSGAKVWWDDYTIAAGLVRYRQRLLIFSELGLVYGQRSSWFP